MNGQGGYKMNTGIAIRITLPSRKYIFAKIGSMLEARARRLELECEIVEFFGACIDANINYRAHEHFPIDIDGVSVTEFIDQIATLEECMEFQEDHASHHPLHT